jgi:O-antigen ligase
MKRALAAASVVMLGFLSTSTLNPWHLPPVSSFYEEWLTACVLITAVLCAYFSFDAQRHQLPKIVLLPSALIVLCILDASIGKFVFPSQASWFLLAPLAWMLALWLGSAVARVRGPASVARALGFGLGLVALGQFALQVLQVSSAGHQMFSFVFEDTGNPGRFPGNTAQPNVLATLDVFALCFGMHALRSQCRFKFGLRLFATIVMLGVSLTGSRIGALETLLMLVVMPWLTVVDPVTHGAADWRTRFHTNTLWSLRWGLWFVLLLIAVPALIAALGLQVDAVGERIVHPKATILYRLPNWFMALHMWREHPWLGVGISNYAAEQMRLLPLVSAVEPSGNAHNVLLHLLAETGLLGTALVMLPLMLWARRVFLARDRNGRLALVLMFVLMLHSMIEFPYALLYMTVPLMVLMGAVDPTVVSIERMPVARAAFLGLVLVAVPTAAYLLVDFNRAADFYAQTPASFQAKNPVRDQQIREGQKSIFFPWVAERYFVYVMDTDDTDTKEKLASIEALMSFGPNSFLAYRRALYLAHLGRDDEAIASVREFGKYIGMSRKTVVGLIYETTGHYPNLMKFRDRLLEEFPQDVERIERGSSGAH